MFKMKIGGYFELSFKQSNKVNKVPNKVLIKTTTTMNREKTSELIYDSKQMYF